MAETIKISSAGRTDAGVHACGQVVSFSTSRAFPFDRLRLALNSGLPDDVGVRESAVVNATFSARFSAMERTYVYAIFNRPQPDPLLARHAYHVWLPIESSSRCAPPPANCSANAIFVRSAACCRRAALRSATCAG